MTGLAVLFPEPDVVLLGRRRVELRAVRLRDFDVFGRVAAQVIGLLANASMDRLHAYAAEHARDLRRALVASTSLRAWQIWRLPASVVVQLMCHAIRANADFFAQALPALEQALATAQAGPTPSNG